MEHLAVKKTRQSHGNRGFALLTRYPQTTTMAVNDMLHNGQSEARAAKLPRAAFIDSVKPLSVRRAKCSGRWFHPD